MLSDYYSLYKEVDLPLQAFTILVLVHEVHEGFITDLHDKDFMAHMLTIELLERQGYVKQYGDSPTDITLRKKGEDLFKKHVGVKKKKHSAADVKQWIDDWRSIFPSGVNNGGYRYRGDKGECIKKMVKFVNDHDFTTDQIFQATKDYVERFSLKGYAYMQLAHFFIHKQGVGSSLAAECEGLNERKPKEEGDKYGRSIV